MAGEALVVNGKSVRAARLLAQRLLQVDERQLLVEVLDHGRRGLFGLFGRPAVIRVTVRPPEEVCPDQRAKEADCDGLAGVTNGVVQVTPPRGRGKPAVIIPAGDVILRVNGVPVHSPREIAPGEEVAVETLAELQAARLEVEIAPDGMTASVRVTPRIAVHHELVDQEPRNVLQLATSRREERLPVFTAAQVEEALAEKGVTFGLDRQAIEQAVSAADGRPRVVARGEPVREGRDGFVEYLFRQEPLPVSYEEGERVNYWERYVFPSVQEGQVLAVLHPPVEGRPGCKVTGELIEPRRVRRASLRVGEGVTVSADGRQAVATQPGRPVLEGYRDPCLRVVQLMVHPGDVDIRSGNLHFCGDILILGSVREGMQVAAHGNITVLGEAEGALLLAGGSIFCRGSLIRCRARAGGLQAFYNRLAPRLAKLGDVLEALLQEVQVVEEHLAALGRTPTDQDRQKLLSLLAARRKQEITSLVEEYLAILEEADIPFPPTVRELALGIKALVNVAGGVAGSGPEQLALLSRQKGDIERLLRSLPDQPGDLLCSYVQNSTLEASGSIVVDGQGCYASRLEAGKRASVLGTFRGGEVCAGESIWVAEAGSPGLSVGKARLRVAAGGTIVLRDAHPEVVVQVGQHAHVFSEKMQYVRVRLSPAGQLHVQPLKV